MLLGTQYYREPGPDPKLWSSDFKQMKEMGLDLVRYWVFWSTINPARDTWDWGKLDRLFDLASEHELGVIVQMVPENQPRWFIEENSGLVPRDPTNTPSQLMGHTIAAAGAYPGITFEHREAQAGMATFIEAVVRRYKDHPGMHTWDVWNEIQPYSVSFDDVSAGAWQDWLRSRFVSIDAFRVYTQVDVSDFNQVPLLWMGHREDHGNGTLPLRHVYREWLANRIVSELDRRSLLVRSIDHEHPIASHRRGSTFRDPVIDDAELANVVDMWGTSNHVANKFFPRDTRELALKLAMARGSSSVKPFWLAETFSGRIYHGYGHYSPTGAEIRSNLSLAFAHGASSAVLWQYRHETFGSEVAGWGLVNFDGSLNDRTEAVAQVSTGIRNLMSAGHAPSRAASRMGLLYDPAVLNMEQSLDEAHQFPLEASITEELTGWFVASQDSGISADIFTPSRLLREGLPAELRVLVAPLNAIANDSVSEHVLSWVRGGGTLVLTAFSEMLNENLMAPTNVPAGGFGKALGLSVLERNYPRHSFDIEVTDDDRLKIKGHLVLEELNISNTNDILGNMQGAPALVNTNLGKGRLVYIATLPGIGYLRGGGDLPRWISRIVPSQRESYSTEDVSNVFFEKLSTSRSEILMAFNPTMNAGGFDLQVTSPVLAVEDLTTGELRFGGAAGLLRIEVPARDCVWLRVAELDEDGRTHINVSQTERLE